MATAEQVAPRDPSTMATRLDEAWGAFCKLIDGCKGWPGDDPRWKDVRDRFARLRADGAAPGDLHARLTELSRGVHLLANALQWSEPVVGLRGTETDRACGEQWRLGMAFGGGEAIAGPGGRVAVDGQDGGSKKEEPGKEPEANRALLARAGVAERKIPVPPPTGKAAEGSGESDQPIVGFDSLTGFLSLEGGDQTHFRRWCEGQAETYEIPEQIALAKCFRNATAHGALSATKALELGIVEVIPPLTGVLGYAGASVVAALSS